MIAPKSRLGGIFHADIPLQQYPLVAIQQVATLKGTVMPIVVMKIVENWTPSGMETDVNKLLAEGWALHGPLSTLIGTSESSYQGARTKNHFKYTQALIRLEPVTSTDSP